ncbi:uncharacterized protein VP01_1650g4 [Puccinia sorghi]|uniref:Major facilitator superfamily (MFS) profile domain-containing protein n=1 Tax=Puccinia sorghi TaxID=27349 RepID=A0A0L6VIE6_9BASI|nr:uncharacterized protein VP01_1650g4 [Puccinia sorghi]
MIGENGVRFHLRGVRDGDCSKVGQHWTVNSCMRGSVLLTDPPGILFIILSCATLHHVSERNHPASRYHYQPCSHHQLSNLPTGYSDQCRGCSVRRRSYCARHHSSFKSTCHFPEEGCHIGCSMDRVIQTPTKNIRGVFLGALDSTIVATLMSSISSSFGASNQISWLASAYLLSTSATGALYGKLADLLGRRMSNLIALGFFTLGTLGCGLSSNMTQLIFSRFLAGCGGGGIMTISSIIATDLFRLDQRGLIQGFANICFGLGAALGGPVGGWITDTLGWRFAFLAQVPLLIIATILVASFVDYRLEGQVTSKAELARRIDYRGSIALIWMIGALLLSLSFKSNLQYEWSDPRVYGNFVSFLVGLGVFIYIESSVPEPILPLRLLKFRTPLCSVGISFFTRYANELPFINERWLMRPPKITRRVLYMYPLWFETVKLRSPTEAGLHLIPNSIALSVGSLAAGGWILKTGQHKMVIFISSALLVLGSLLMLFKLDSPIHEWIDIIPNGLGFSASTTAVLSKRLFFLIYGCLHGSILPVQIQWRSNWCCSS